MHGSHAKRQSRPPGRELAAAMHAAVRPNLWDGGVPSVALLPILDRLFLCVVLGAQSLQLGGLQREVGLF
jgi:hypothetical protein